MASIKLKYDKTEKREEPVAYVDGAGDLIIFDKTGENEAMSIFQYSYGNEAMSIFQYSYGNESPVVLTTANWSPEEAQHKFYKGDTVKLTITF